jgi:hypothetical protein
MLIFPVPINIFWIRQPIPNLMKLFGYDYFSQIDQLLVDLSTWFIEPKRNESPTEYNIDVVTLASRKLNSSAATTGQGSSSKQYLEPVHKQKNMAAVSKILLVDSPA